MRKVAVYIRVSTLEQAQEGYSVGEQKERLLAYCKAHDWIVSDIYVDGGYSGANLNRPAIQKLMNEIKNFDIVLVYKLDRLSRSQRDTLYLIEDVFLPNKVDFVSMQESFDTSSPFGKAMIGLLAVFAQLEREQIKERTRMGRVARAKSGLHQGCCQIPIGYTYQNGKLIINPYEAEQIRLIYTLYLEGASYQNILNQLNEKGYTNSYSGYKHWSGIRYILSNETYTGRLRYGEVVVEKAHEAIISEEQFKAVQALHEKRNSVYGTNSFHAKHLLAGMVFCGHCGARYVYRPNGNNPVYCCYSRAKINKSMIRDPNCKNKHWNKEELERIVSNRVRNIFNSPEMAAEVFRRDKVRKKLEMPSNVGLEKRLHEIDRQINKLMELYKIDGIPADVLGDNINKLYQEKTALQSSVQPLDEVEENSFTTFYETLGEVVKVCIVKKD